MSDGTVKALPMSDVRAIYVETNDTGPWDADVWWLVEGLSGEIEITFPQLSSGEDQALARFQRLPGFAVSGMNSTANARFECWRAPD
jgi:hypothetical protein